MIIIFTSNFNIDIKLAIHFIVCIFAICFVLTMSKSLTKWCGGIQTPPLNFAKQQPQQLWQSPNIIS